MLFQGDTEKQEIVNLLYILLFKQINLQASFMRKLKQKLISDRHFCRYVKKDYHSVVFSSQASLYCRKYNVW